MKKNNTNNKPIRTALRFSISMVVIATAAILAFGSTIVQVHTGNGFDNGYAKAKYDFANNHVFNDSCSPKGAYCQQYLIGYETAWIQYHWNTGMPNNMTLLTVNKTA